jgi:hypothetical protein
LLWISDEPNCPDIGLGVNGNHDLWELWSDPLQEPVINEPGIHRTFCVELDLYGLAVCAIMNSGELGSDNFSVANSKQLALDGSEEDKTFGHSSTAYSDQGCLLAFR